MVVTMLILMALSLVVGIAITLLLVMLLRLGQHMFAFIVHAYFLTDDEEFDEEALGADDDEDAEDAHEKEWEN